MCVVSDKIDRVSFVGEILASVGHYLPSPLRDLVTHPVRVLIGELGMVRISGCEQMAFCALRLSKQGKKLQHSGS